MKKSIKFSVLALMIAGSVACSKDEDNDTTTPPPPPTDQELVQGEWTGTHLFSYTYKPETQDTSYSMESSYGRNYIINEDGSFTTYRRERGDTLRGTYVLDGTEMTWMYDIGDTSVAEVLTLNEESFIFKSETRGMTDTTVYVGSISELSKP